MADGEDSDAGPVARGIIRIHLLDFLVQLTTFRARGPGPWDEARALVRFGRFFLGELWEVYGRDISRPTS